MYFRICPVAIEKTCINLNVVLTYKEIFKKFEFRERCPYRNYEAESQYFMCIYFILNINNVTSIVLTYLTSPRLFFTVTVLFESFQIMMWFPWIQTTKFMQKTLISNLRTDSRIFMFQQQNIRRFCKSKIFLLMSTSWHMKSLFWQRKKFTCYFCSFQKLRSTF